MEDGGMEGNRKELKERWRQEWMKVRIYGEQNIWRRG